jgi:hypothetical protein
MQSSTVRIDEETRAMLRELAEKENDSMQAILRKALEAYRRERFLDAVNVAYAALRADPKAWAEELKERKVWDVTLLDGLEEDEEA